MVLLASLLLLLLHRRSRTCRRVVVMCMKKEAFLQRFWGRADRKGEGDITNIQTHEASSIPDCSKGKFREREGGGGGSIDVRKDVKGELRVPSKFAYNIGNSGKVQC